MRLVCFPLLVTFQMFFCWEVARLVAIQRFHDDAVERGQTQFVGGNFSWEGRWVRTGWCWELVGVTGEAMKPRRNLP